MVSTILRKFFEKNKKDLLLHLNIIVLLIELIFILIYLPLKVQPFVYVQF